MNKDKITADLIEANQLVALYAKLGETYMAIGKRDLAYAKREEAIAFQSKAKNLEALLKAS